MLLHIAEYDTTFHHVEGREIGGEFSQKIISFITG